MQSVIAHTNPPGGRGIPGCERTERRRRSARLGVGAALSLVLVGIVLPRGAFAQRSPAADSLAYDSSDPSPAVAGVLSLATTGGPMLAGAMLDDGVGLALVGAGLLFGPLSGYAYGDVMDRGVGGLAFRSAVAAGGTLAIFALCQAGDCNPFRDNPTDEDVSEATLGVVIVVGAVLIGSAAIDVLSAPDHVTRANRERAAAEGTAEASARTGAELSVYPLVSTGGRGGGVGLGATVRF